ncbi:hypothetical protein AMECASPLE_001866 [Ameca splendens]|uniref:Uncharacterized protein n=1 Tax=Ameca splendens TaxID=208324 RepID=A0ABV0Y9V3_9TELE
MRRCCHKGYASGGPGESDADLSFMEVTLADSNEHPSSAHFPTEHVTGTSSISEVTLCPCDGLAICPGCTPPLARRLLEIGTSSPATLFGRSGYENRWMDGFSDVRISI